MLIGLLLGLVLFHSGYSSQKKYEYCKSIEFKDEFCSLQKKMNKYDDKQ